MYNNELSPVLLFVYDRLAHTKKTIECLQKNDLAQESVLIVISDAAKNKDDENKVQSVRDYIKTISGFKEIKLIYRKRNWGLADNIIDGVNKVVNRYGRVIVLEDDIIVSSFFLKFMNDALNQYEKCSNVMAISGYLHPIDNLEVDTPFFMPWFSCWGWATWKDRWVKFERKPEKLIYESNLSFISFINVNGTAPDMWQQVVDNYRKKIKTWAIFYYVAICKNKGVVLYPPQSMCTNIGFDGSGENCDNSDWYDTCICDEEIINLPNNVSINNEVISKFKKFNYKRIGLKQYIFSFLEMLLFKLFSIIKNLK